MELFSGKTQFEIENSIIKFWNEKKIYQKVKAARKGGKKFFFLDGPPYATGNIHMGHALNKVTKDFYIRFFRMNGMDVWDRPGFDTHGLPIENKVEKKLNFKSKQDIEAFGVEKFIEECRRFATEHISSMTSQFKDLGVWMDWDNPYLTLHNDYIEGAWFTFKKAFEKGLLSQGSYPVHVCPRCETAVAYNEIIHKKSRDPSLFVKFKLKNDDRNLLIWTTTPWTIPANTGAMVKSDEDYSEVDVGGEAVIIASKLVKNVMEKMGVKDYKVSNTIKGNMLIGLEYESPLGKMIPQQQSLKNGRKVVDGSQYVTMEDGTGIVHLSPSNGNEDFKVGTENKLPMIPIVGVDGKFIDGTGELSGLSIKEAGKLVVQRLEESHRLLYKNTVEHEYPFCWRCENPLIIVTVPQWFFKVTDIRKTLKSENEKTNWIPDWAKSRFGNWLDSLGDWPVSRQRYWGIPLPIWKCDSCGDITVVGSVKELKSGVKDLHKPHIDSVKLKCKKCRGSMTRVPEVLDVWFDSGVAPWASLGFSKSRKLFDSMWPVDFILEGSDMIRGWFNSLMITGVMTFDRRPMDNVLLHGLVLDAHGIKMSKSVGNVVDPIETSRKYGRDILRAYLLSDSPSEDKNFNWEKMEEVRKTFAVIKNTINFVKTYVASGGSSSGMKDEDRWILSRLNNLVSSSTKDSESFYAYKALQDIMDFVTNDFSRWYIKLIRDRTSTGYSGKDKSAAFYTLMKVSETVTMLLAPFTPFIAEELYQNLMSGTKGGKISVHMTDWPKAEKKFIDNDLEEQMEFVKRIFEMTQAARQEAGIKLRWPLKQIVVVPKKDQIKSAVKSLEDNILFMCNVKSVMASGKSPDGNFVKIESPAGDLYLDKDMDEDIMNEAMFRELVRFIQNMRKTSGLSVRDEIKLSLNSDGKNDVMKKFKKEIMKEVGAKSLDIGILSGSNSEKMDFEGTKIEVAFDKI